MSLDRAAPDADGGCVRGGRAGPVRQARPSSCTGRAASRPGRPLPCREATRGHAHRLGQSGETDHQRQFCSPHFTLPGPATLPRHQARGREAARVARLIDTHPHEKKYTLEGLRVYTPLTPKVQCTVKPTLGVSFQFAPGLS